MASTALTRCLTTRQSCRTPSGGLRVQLSRHDEMAWENYGFAYVIDQRVALDAKGSIVAWDCESWNAALGGRPGGGTPGNVITGSLLGLLQRRSVHARSHRHHHLQQWQQRGALYVADACAAGTYAVKGERVHAHHSIAVLHRPAAIAQPNHRTPSRTNRSWTNWRHASRSNPSTIDCAYGATRSRCAESGGNCGALGDAAVAQTESQAERAHQEAAASRAFSMKATMAIARWWPRSRSTRTRAQSTTCLRRRTAVRSRHRWHEESDRGRAARGPSRWRGAGTRRK